MSESGDEYKREKQHALRPGVTPPAPTLMLFHPFGETDPATPGTLDEWLAEVGIESAECGVTVCERVEIDDA